MLAPFAEVTERLDRKYDTNFTSWSPVSGTSLLKAPETLENGEILELFDKI